MEEEEPIPGLEVIARYKISRRTLIDWLDKGLQAVDSVRREKILIYPGSFYELRKPDASPWSIERRYPQPFSRRSYTGSYEEYLDAIERNIDLLIFNVSDIKKFRKEHGLSDGEPKQIGRGKTAKHETANNLSRTDLDLKTFADKQRGKHPDMTIPSIVRRFLESKSIPSFECNESGKKPRGYQPKTLEKRLRKLFNSSSI
jgi:hypothetical protein